MAATFSEGTIDDLLHVIYEHLIANGNSISPSKGDAREDIAVSLELTNPRSRISRSAARSTIVSCLGELAWYLSGSDAEDDIAYYVPAYRDYAVEGRLLGAYGPRLLGGPSGGQLRRVIEQLRAKQDTRQAVIQLFDAEDLVRGLKDLPCTCTLQFLVRDGSLHLVVYMRSNDAYIGLPHDVFCFTMLQELVAACVNADLGRYVHIVGSLHLYESHVARAKAYLDEGWWAGQAGEMPSMPRDNSWQGVEAFLHAESSIRASDTPDSLAHLSSGSSYWDDLAVILLAHRQRKTGSLGIDAAPDLSVAHDFFRLYLDDRLAG